MTPDEAIVCIEEAARQERLAGSNVQDCDDPEPAREAIREWFRVAQGIANNAEIVARELAPEKRWAVQPSVLMGDPTVLVECDDMLTPGEALAMSMDLRVAAFRSAYGTGRDDA